jgi:uncharacterized protein YdeI (YjbR/CyaY-like superfamily)
VLPAALPVLNFAQPDGWNSWLVKNHKSSIGVWIHIAKAPVAAVTLSQDDALAAALCFGWIDGQKKTLNDQFWLQKFTPLTDRSPWSQINKDKAQALLMDGKMKLAGQQAIERAKRDGRWGVAYEPGKKAAVPADLQHALDDNPIAKAFFATLDRRNRYAILFRIQTTAKPQARAARVAQFVDLLEQHEKVYQ